MLFATSYWPLALLTLYICPRMKQIDFKKHVLPHLIAVTLFLVITVVFFSPVFFKGQMIAQHDIQQWEGSAKELIDFREQTGEEGLWTNSMFGGMPAYLVNVIWSDQPVEYLHRLFTLFLPHPVRVIFGAMLAFYIMMLAFKARPSVSIGVALAFALSSYMVIGLVAGHNARIGAIAYFPLVIAGVHLALHKFRWLGLGVTTAALAMHLRINHLQITYYLLLTLVVYGLVYLISSYKKKTLKPFLTTLGLLSIGAVIAVFSMIGKFWSTYEYGKYSMRGQSELTSTASGDASGLAKDYAFQYSNSIFEPLVMFIPDFMGGASSAMLISDEDSETLDALRRSNNPQEAQQLARFARGYWGKQPATAPYYAGAIVGFLFILGIFLVDRKTKSWLLIIFGMGVVLSWGSNFSAFNYFMFDHFPLYNKFRSVTFIILLSIFSACLLGGLGLNTFLDDPKKYSQALLRSGMVYGALLIVLLLGAGMINMRGPSDLASQLPIWFTAALQDDRVALFRADVLRTLLFSGLAFALLWLRSRGKIKTTVAAAGISLLILVDSWSVDSRYISEDNYQRNPSNSFFTQTDVDKAILADKEPGYRVYNLQGAMSEARTSYFHRSLGGYHGAKLRRYQDLYDRVLQNETQVLISKLQNGDQDYSELSVINMLNTKYFYVGSSTTGVFRNPNPNGAAWFVNNVTPVNNADEEIDAVANFNSTSTAVIDQSKFSTQTSYPGTGTITLTTYKPNRLVYEAQTSGPSLAVFSEIYYPKGWIATIDGEEVPILRANYVLRALEVPEGSHTIEFQFKPAVYTWGDPVTAAFNYVVILMLLGSFYLTLRSENTSEQV